MKKPKRVRRKAKFRVGQVVFIRPDVRYDVIEERFFYENGEWIYAPKKPADGVRRGLEHEYYENELRPLTTKEIGPRRKLGR